MSIEDSGTSCMFFTPSSSHCLRLTTSSVASSLGSDPNSQWTRYSAPVQILHPSSNNARAPACASWSSTLIHILLYRCCRDQTKIKRHVLLCMDTKSCLISWPKYIPFHFAFLFAQEDREGHEHTSLYSTLSA